MWNKSPRLTTALTEVFVPLVVIAVVSNAHGRTTGDLQTFIAAVVAAALIPFINLFVLSPVFKKTTLGFDSLEYLALRVSINAFVGFGCAKYFLS